ncbi:MAG: protein kinase [Ktedonobacteraceae bacterium]|nr:protein kinase [Ktedonobacteraceae bacterium]
MKMQNWQRGEVLLEQYEVLGILGEGGMGTVYKVHHRGWNIDLAVKSPQQEIFTRAGGKENFMREAETWVSLPLHPHIVSCYYVRIVDEIPRIFAEYVAGGSLADWIRSRRLYEGGPQQALERMLDIAIQFAWGLHAAHEQGLVHQDIKPANVMMSSEGIAKVTDFGLAKARVMVGEQEERNGESGQRSILVSARGMTPAYCSPEQMVGNALSRKTDIWSWAVSLLEMFVGDVIWRSGTLAREILASYEPQDAAIPPLPTEVGTLLTRCFAFQPEDRPETMLEVATRLQEIYAHEMEQAYPREAPQPTKALAATLNNRALSLFDLGKVEQAMCVWEQALQTDPQHLEANYNRGVVLWRQGKLSDDALINQLKMVRAAQFQSGWGPICLPRSTWNKGGSLLLFICWKKLHNWYFIARKSSNCVNTRKNSFPLMKNYTCMTCMGVRRKASVPMDAGLCVAMTIMTVM